MKKYRLAIAVAVVSLVCVALVALWLGRPDSGTRQPAPVRTGAGRTAESAAPGVEPGTGQPSAAGKQEVPSAGTSPKIEVAKSTPASRGAAPFPSGPAGPPATGAQPTASGAQPTAGGAQPAATPAPLMPPKSLAGFYSWPEHKQVEAVTALMENAHLPREVRDFFTNALKDNRLSSLVRNNMLNALENQDKVNHDLWRTLAAIIDDPKQDKEWRLFAVQHLGAVYADSSDRKSVESKLRGLFQGNDPEFSAQGFRDRMRNAEFRGDMSVVSQDFVEFTRHPKMPEQQTFFGGWEAGCYSYTRLFEQRRSPWERVPLVGL